MLTMLTMLTAFTAFALIAVWMSATFRDVRHDQLSSR